MPECFEPLDAKLRAVPFVAVAPPATIAAVEPNAAPELSRRDAAVVALAGRLVLLEVAAAEACERNCRRVVRALADEVLTRELLLAPADIECLIQKWLARLHDAQPVSLVVGPGPLPATTGPPIRVDASLTSGDVLLEVRDGLVDLRLAVRFESALKDAQ